MTLCPACAGPSLNGNLEISVTTVPWFRNVRVKHFEDNEKVKNAILASACIVPPPLYLPGHGWAIDGAFSDFQILKVMHVLCYASHCTWFWEAVCSADRQHSAHFFTSMSKVMHACVGSLCGWQFPDHAQ